MPISRDSTDIVIVGGGAAGLTVAGLLCRSRPSISIALVEPSDGHFYPPAWTLVGAGEFNVGTTRRSTAELIPPVRMAAQTEFEDLRSAGEFT